MKKGFSSTLILVALFIGLILTDFSIKRWVYSHLFEPIVVWKSPLGIDFILQYVTNRGGAWGMLAAYHKPILILRILVIMGLLFYLWQTPTQLKKKVGLVIILAGAVGNVIDSFVYGYVIDMFHFVFWERSYGIFNFADALIFVGAIYTLVVAKKKVLHAH